MILAYITYLHVLALGNNNTNNNNDNNNNNNNNKLMNLRMKLNIHLLSVINATDIKEINKNWHFCFFMLDTGP